LNILRRHDNFLLPKCFLQLLAKLSPPRAIEVINHHLDNENLIDALTRAIPTALRQARDYLR